MNKVGPERLWTSGRPVFEGSVTHRRPYYLLKNVFDVCGNNYEVLDSSCVAHFPSFVFLKPGLRDKTCAFWCVNNNNILVTSWVLGNQQKCSGCAHVMRSDPVVSRAFNLKGRSPRRAGRMKKASCGGVVKRFSSENLGAPAGINLDSPPFFYF